MVKTAQEMRASKKTKDKRQMRWDCAAEEKLDEETGNIVAHREENLYCDYMKERRNGNCWGGL